MSQQRILQQLLLNIPPERESILRLSLPVLTTISILVVSIVFTICFDLAIVLAYLIGGGVATVLFFTVKIINASSRNRRRLREFDAEYPAFLLALATSIRGGSDPLVALLNLQTLFHEKSLLAEELSRFAERFDEGKSEEECIYEFGSSIAHPDLALFRAAMILSRKQGSSISPTLTRLVKVIRTRQSLRRKARAAVVSQRFSCFGILGVALVTTLGLGLIQRNALLDTLYDPRGMLLILAGGGLILVGALLMLQITRERLT
jgi:Flp pilus assembly protein TadB